MKTHKDLDIWKGGMDIVKEVYSVTKDFPKEEMYGLTAQMRRSAVSIPSNIAEGAARKGRTENIQFLYIALGSLSELETQVLISKELGFLTDIASIAEMIEKERRKLLNYIKYVKEK